VALVLMICVGVLAKTIVVSIIGAVGLLIYTVIRVFTPGAVAAS